jgi:hypothetical protein
MDFLNHMRTPYILLVIALPLFSSCASITKTQISSIHNYSQLLENNSAYPGIIVKEYISIEYEIQKLNTGTFNDSEVNGKMWNSYKGKNKALNEVHKVDLCLKILCEYASALEKLSSKDLYENMVKPSQKLGTEIDTLIQEFNGVNNNPIPVGIGKLISSSLTNMGSRWVRNKQAGELKKYIQEGDILISLTTDMIGKNLDTLILKQWIPGLVYDLKSRQESLLRNLNPKGDYKAYYATEFNKEVADLIERIDLLEQLTIKTISSVKRVRKAHLELLTNIEKRKKIQEVLKETQSLYVSTKEIYDSYTSLIQSKKNALE